MKIKRNGIISCLISFSVICFLFAGSLLFSSPALSDTNNFILPAGLKTIDDQSFMNDESINGTLVIPEGVEYIGSEAFRNCTSLSGVPSIPDTVSYIGSKAFAGCTGLEGVLYLDEGVEVLPDAFEGTNIIVCSGNDISLTDFEYSILDDGTLCLEKYNGDLTAVNIPSCIDGKLVTHIGWECFCNNETIRAVYLPDTIVSIDDGARVGKQEYVVGSFAGCTSLMNVRLSTNLSVIGNYSFFGCKALRKIVLSENLSRIGEFAFGSSGLLRINVPEGVNSIGKYAFSRCTELVKAYIPGSALELKGWTFWYCTNLKEVTIGEGLTKIGWYEFESCSSLQYLNLPSSLSQIGQLACYKCTHLANVVLPNGITELGNGAFEDCVGLVNVEIPDSLSAFHPSFFFGCVNLKSLTASDSCLSFSSENGMLLSKDKSILCYVPEGMESVEIPDSVTAIGAGAFLHNSKIKTINIPDGVTSIGASAFSGCTGLMSVSIPDTVVSVGNGAFNNCSSLSLVQYEGTPEQWSAWADNLLTDLNESLAAINVYYSAESDDTIVLESSHPFWDYNSWSYTHPEDAGGLLVTFSKKTDVSCDFEGGYITIIDANGAERWYLGNSLAGVTLALPGNSFSLNMEIMVGDSYGFAITAIEALSQQEYEAYLLQHAFNTAILDDGTLEIKGYQGNDSRVVVPSQINGIAVTRIGDYAFSCIDEIVSIEIPSSVTSFGKWAFAACHNLESILFTDSVTSIGDYAFYVTKLSSVVIPDSVTEIGEAAFYFCLNLTDVVLPARLKRIEDCTFRDCHNLQNVTIPNGVASIGSGAFESCRSLSEITIPDSVTCIEPGAFECCSGLKSIRIPRSTAFIGEYPVFPEHSDELTIYGYIWSEAEQCAKREGIPFSYLSTAQGMAVIDISPDIIIDNVNITPLSYYETQIDLNVAINHGNDVFNPFTDVPNYLSAADPYLSIELPYCCTITDVNNDDHFYSEINSVQRKIRYYIPLEALSNVLDFNVPLSIHVQCGSMDEGVHTASHDMVFQVLSANGFTSDVNSETLKFIHRDIIEILNITKFGNSIIWPYYEGIYADRVYNLTVKWQLNKTRPSNTAYNVYLIDLQDKNRRIKLNSHYISGNSIVFSSDIIRSFMSEDSSTDVGFRIDLVYPGTDQIIYTVSSSYDNDNYRIVQRESAYNNGMPPFILGYQSAVLFHDMVYKGEYYFGTEKYRGTMDQIVYLCSVLYDLASGDLYNIDLTPEERATLLAHSIMEEVSATKPEEYKLVSEVKRFLEIAGFSADAMEAYESSEILQWETETDMNQLVWTPNGETVTFDEYVKGLIGYDTTLQFKNFFKDAEDAMDIVDYVRDIAKEYLTFCTVKRSDVQKYIDLFESSDSPTLRFAADHLKAMTGGEESLSVYLVFLHGSQEGYKVLLKRGYEIATEKLIGAGWKLVNKGIRILGDFVFNASEVFNTEIELMTVCQMVDGIRNDYSESYLQLLDDPVGHFNQFVRDTDMIMSLLSVEASKYIAARNAAEGGATSVNNAIFSLVRFFNDDDVDINANDFISTCIELINSELHKYKNFYVAPFIQ